MDDTPDDDEDQAEPVTVEAETDEPEKDRPPVDQVRLQRLRRVMDGRWYGPGGPPPEVAAKWAKAEARRRRRESDGS